MGPALIALFLTAGVGTWIYTKLMRRTGNNTQSVLIATAAASLLIFLRGLFYL